MTSKSSFFELLKDNFIRRIWTLAVSALFFFFYFPISTLLSVNNYLGSSYEMPDIEKARARYWIFSEFKSLHEAGGAILTFIFFFAIIMAVSAFSYLHDRKKTDFYHSLPVSRVKLFAVNYLNSFVIMTVPYLVMSMISAAIAASGSGYGGCFAFALISFAENMGFFALLYAFAVLAMIMTGSRIVGVLGMLVFCFWGPFVVYIADTLKTTYFMTYFQEGDKLNVIYKLSSPLVWSTGELTNVYVHFGDTLRAAVAYAGGVIVALIALWLYLIRRSETAGRSMAFKYTEAPIKFIVVIPAALMFGVIFSSLSSENDGWTVFGIIFGMLILHSLMEIIYNSDFKKLFSNKLQLAGCMVLGLLVFAFFKFDISGFESFLPEDDNVESAGVFTYAMDQIYTNDEDVTLNEGEFVYNVEQPDMTERDIVNRMFITDTDTVKKIAEAGIEQSDYKNRSEYYSSGDEEYKRTILVGWHLKNGTTKYRQYYLDFKSIRDELDSVHDNIEYKKGIYPILDKDEDYASKLSGVNYKDILGYHNLDSAEAAGRIEELYDTYREELGSLTIEERRHETPVCGIQFKTEAFQAMSDSIKAMLEQNRDEYSYLLSTLNYIDQYPVYPSFKKTLALLNECGASINNDIDADDVSAIVISGYYYGEVDENGNAKENKPDLIVSDKAEISEILESASFEILNNELCPIYYDVDMRMHTSDSYYLKDRNRGTSDLGINIESAAEPEGNESEETGVTVSESTVYIDESESEQDGSETVEADLYIDESGEEDTAENDSGSVKDSEAAAYAALYSSGTYGYDDSAYSGSYTIYFKCEDIPQFVKDYFEIDEAAINQRIKTFAW